MSRSALLVAAACVCFAVALLVDLSVIQSNEPAWRDGGLLAFALSFLP